MMHKIYIYISENDVKDLQLLRMNEEEWLNDLPFELEEGVHEVSLDAATKWRDQVDPVVFNQYDELFGLKMKSFHYAVY